MLEFFLASSIHNLVVVFIVVFEFYMNIYEDCFTDHIIIMRMIMTHNQDHVIEFE